MSALKVVTLLACIYTGMYATIAMIHVMQQTWTAYKIHQKEINAKGVYGLKIATRFCASYILILVQSVASLIWDLYMDTQFPLYIRIPLTLTALLLAVTSVIPVNLITSGIIESMLRVSHVKIKIETVKDDPKDEPQKPVQEETRKSA